jgi:hypothetical protein
MPIGSDGGINCAAAHGNGLPHEHGCHPAASCRPEGARLFRIGNKNKVEGGTAMNLQTILAPMIRLLERTQVSYAIIGGYAVAAWGELRTTQDIDFFCAPQDLANSFAVVQNVRIFPFGREALIAVAFFIALPILPLTLTMFSLQEMVVRLVQVLL